MTTAKAGSLTFSRLPQFFLPTSSPATLYLEATGLYWQVGQAIRQPVPHQQRGPYGQQVVKTIAAALTQEFGKGWSSRHLHACLQVAEAFADAAIVHTLYAQFQTPGRLEEVFRALYGKRMIEKKFSTTTSWSASSSGKMTSKEYKHN